MDDFISFARQTWKEFGRKAPVSQPKEDFVIPPRVTPKQDQTKPKQEQEKAKREQERIKQEQEKAKREEERIKKEQERIKREEEKLKQEEERVKQEEAKQEQERLKQEQERAQREQERQEQERAKQEQARQEKEKAKQEKEQAKQEREKARQEQERIKQEQERIKKEQERVKKEQERVRQEQERIKQEQEKAEREQERLKQQQERAQQEQAKQEQERARKEEARLEKERIKQEKERIRQEKERVKQEQAQLKQEQERIRREQAKAEQERLKQEMPVKAHPVVIDEVVAPAPPEPQPQPVEPIQEVPVVEEKTIDFTFFGTHGQVRCDVFLCPKLPVAKDTEVADALTVLSSDRFDNLIIDCLKLRDDLHLSDWAYLLMLREMANAICGKDTNGSVLLMAYVYMQSGYKMRLASDGNKLFMLYASKHTIYEQGAFEVDGDLYYGIEGLPEKMYICQASFPREKGLSLFVNSNQRLDNRPSEERTIISKAFPDVRLTTSVNLNLIDFYNTYPTSSVGGNLMSRWAMYANTPLDSLVEAKALAELKPKLQGLSQKDAVERLLNLVQTGLEYEYDTKVWGHDRAFFAEESVFYPYADCEDRSILLSRLVRDLLGLKCVLIYYPRHLAMAVHFTERVNGDVIYLDNVDYVVCDPTFISGAPVGRTMPDVDNRTAKAILLQ